MLLALLLLGCPKPVDLGPPEAGTPILPAPEGEVYTLSPTPPRDPLVAWIVAPPAADRKAQPPDPLPYDEVLGGAAAGVGMGWVDNGGQVDQAMIRWTTFLAGWPYPIDGFSMESVPPGGLPESLIDPAVAPPDDQHLGLARVRGPSGEVWVLITSPVPLPMAPFARDQAQGATLKLRPLAEETPGWSDLQQRSLSPSLQEHVGAVALDEPGEWIVELRATGPDGQRRLLVRAPVYVEEGTPADGPFLEVLPAPADPAEAVRQALVGVDELRGLVEARAVTTDPMLAAVARKEAERLAGGGAPSSDREQRLRAAGYPEGPVAELTCQARTVHECLDGLFWAIDTRKQLLNPAFDAVGVGAAQVNGRTRLVLTFGRR